jgi:hypothetical protein
MFELLVLYRLNAPLTRYIYDEKDAEAAATILGDWEENLDDWRKVRSKKPLL